MKQLFVCVSMLLLLTGTLSAENYRYSSDTSRQGTMTQNITEPTVNVADHPKLGRILTDSRGMTLYMFTPDKNQSTCYDQCAVTWPPLLSSSGKPHLASGITGRLGFVMRDDNTQQVTYNGMPLYYYIKDKKPGDIYGQNVENKWFVVNPR